MKIIFTLIFWDLSYHYHYQHHQTDQHHLFDQLWLFQVALWIFISSILCAVTQVCLMYSVVMLSHRYHLNLQYSSIQPPCKAGASAGTVWLCRAQFFVARGCRVTAWLPYPCSPHHPFQRRPMASLIWETDHSQLLSFFQLSQLQYSGIAHSINISITSTRAYFWCGLHFSS